VTKYSTATAILPGANCDWAKLARWRRNSSSSGDFATAKRCAPTHASVGFGPQSKSAAREVEMPLDAISDNAAAAIIRALAKTGAGIARSP
jgi:hypothetical protein